MDSLVSSENPEVAPSEKMKELRQLMLQTLDKQVWRSWTTLAGRGSARVARQGCESVPVSMGHAVNF